MAMLEVVRSGTVRCRDGYQRHLVAGKTRISESLVSENPELGPFCSRGSRSRSRVAARSRRGGIASIARAAGISPPVVVITDVAWHRIQNLAMENGMDGMEEPAGLFGRIEPGRVVIEEAFESSPYWPRARDRGWIDLDRFEKHARQTGREFVGSLHGHRSGSGPSSVDKKSWRAMLAGEVAVHLIATPGRSAFDREESFWWPQIHAYAVTGSGVRATRIERST